jgi:putative Mn2+ efflux pump MntP
MGIAAIAASIIAAYISYLVYKHNRLKTAWLAITAAMALMVLRRTIRFIADTGGYPDLNDLLITASWAIVLATSILLIIGLWSLKSSFERYDLVEKRAEKKLADFSKGRGGKAKKPK